MEKKPRFLELLMHIIGVFDPYGRDHSERVAELSVKLARRAGIRDGTPEMDDIELAALLHDIGKIGIPENIRRMPGKYTGPERMIMQTHSIIGMEFLLMVPNGGLSHEMKLDVKHHHENWNGTGYPDQLSGRAIPMGARLIRICDYFDALTHDRGYRIALTKEDAINTMIEKQIESQWADPDLFRLFLEMMN